MKRPAMFLLVSLLGALFLHPAVADERRPVEGRWEFPEALASDATLSPAKHYVLIADKTPVVFRVDPADLALFTSSRVTYDIPEALAAKRDTEGVAGIAGDRFTLTAPVPGDYRLAVKIEGPEGAFTLVYEAHLVVVTHPSDIPPPPEPAAAPEPAAPAPGPIDAKGVKGRPRATATPNYASVSGVLGTYIFTSENRRYMRRGIKLELWDSTTLLATVHANDETGEGNCGIDYEDYVDTTNNTWHHVSDTGWFDFGEVWVGSGKTLRIREVHEFYAGASGASAGGTLRARSLDYDNSDAQVVYWWNLGMVDSGEDKWLGLYSPALSATNGSVADESAHALFDISRMYRFFRDCTGFYTPYVTVHLYLSNLDAPGTGGEDMYLRRWDNDYLLYPYTDSIRHEYTHAMHYHMRGGSMPPRAPGDVNHGNCANSDSADAVIEGFARYVPPLILRDGVYHWTATSTQNMATGTNRCVDPIPDDRHEWAVGPALWQSWTNAGATNAFANCTTDSFVANDPDYVRDMFDFMVADCAYDQNLWAGFFHHSINYDEAAPENPDPISVSPNRRWTNDTTPTWSWSLPYDALSGIDGFGVYLSAGIGSPSAVKDIEEVTSYTPTTMADGSNYYLNLRSVDNAGNWASGYTYQGPIGIDTVDPGTAGSLVSTSHTVSAWSTNPTLVMTWTAASDDRSGLDGYGLFTTTAGPSDPGTVKDIEAVTTYTDTLSSSAIGWYFNLRSVDNAGNWQTGAAHAGPYFVDNVLPGGVTGLASTSHATGAWSTDATVDFAWTAAPDAHSGIDGYGLLWGTAALIPGQIKDIEEVTTYTQTAASSATGRYFNIRAVDHAGNWQTDFVSVGPYYIDAALPTTPPALTSSTHPVGSCQTDAPAFHAGWSASTDAHSGLAGYSWVFSLDAPASPDAVVDLPAGALAIDTAVSASPSPRYFNLAARDVAGNLSLVASHGPFTMDRYPLEILSLRAAYGLPAPEAVDLSWGGTKAADYRVDRSTAPQFAAFDSFMTDVTQWTDAAPPVARVVYYRVIGINACGVIGE